MIRFYNAAISLMPDWILTDARFFNSPEEAGFIVQFVPEENPIFELEIQLRRGGSARSQRKLPLLKFHG